MAQKTTLPDEKILGTLSKLEQKLAKVMSRVEIRGKFCRNSVVLLTPDLVQAITLITELRPAMKCKGDLVFIRPKADHPFRASDALREEINNMNLLCGDAITWTSLRKHVATMSQVRELF